MKNKKKVVIGGILAVSIFSVGLFGGQALGNSSWSTPIISQANTVLGQAGADKVGALTNKNNISNQMKSLLEPEIEAQQQELERLLEEYYRMKLEGLTDTEEYKIVEAKIKEIRDGVFKRYKEEIDKAFK